MSSGGIGGSPNGFVGGDGSQTSGGNGGSNPYGQGGGAPGITMYAVTHPAWCSFLNTHGVWGNPDGVNPVGQWAGYDLTVNIAQPGKYTARISGDNHARMYIDNVLIGTMDSYTYYSDYLVTLTAGPIKVRVEGYNDGGPAGVAAALINSNDVVVWATSAGTRPGTPAAGYGSGGAGGGNPGSDRYDSGQNGLDGFVTLTWG